MSSGDTPALVLDTLGKLCPIPVIELAKHIRDVPVGDLVAVLSDDDAAALDIPAFCRMRGHDYAGEGDAADVGADRGRLYLVRRRS
jgi:cysteine desulfurase